MNDKHVFYLATTEKIYNIVEQHRRIADQEYRHEDLATLIVIQQEIVQYDKDEARRICKDRKEQVKRFYREFKVEQKETMDKIKDLGGK